MTEAACGGGDLQSRLAPGRSGTQISMGLCFSRELFLPIKQACVCMSVERCGELFFFKKRKKKAKKNHNNKVACVRAVFGVPCPYSPDPVTTPARASVSLVFKEG